MRRQWLWHLKLPLSVIHSVAKFCFILHGGVLLVAVSLFSPVCIADSFSFISDLLPLRHFAQNPVFTLSSHVCSMFPDLAFLPQDPTLMPLCSYVPFSLVSTLQPQCFCFPSPMLYNTPPPHSLCPQAGISLLSLSLLIGVWTPAGHAETQGTACVSRYMGKNNKLLKKELESRTYYLLPRAAPMQALGTPTG